MPERWITGFPTTPGTTARPPAATETTYLITGGAGFIGSHLTEALLDRGDRAIRARRSFDRLRRRTWRGWPIIPGSLTVTGSIRDELVVDELMHKCDAVVHLAAAVGVRLIIDEPLRSFTTNLRGSEVVIEAAHQLPTSDPDRQHLGGVREERSFSPHRNRRPHPRTNHRRTLGLQHRKGGRRDTGADLSPRARPPSGRSPGSSTPSARADAAYGMVIPTL